MCPSQGEQTGRPREKEGLRAGEWGLDTCSREEEVDLKGRKGSQGQGERRELVTALSMASSAPMCGDPPPLRLLKDRPATSCHLCCLAESPGSLLSQPGSSDFPGSGLLPNQPRPSSIRVWGM